MTSGEVDDELREWRERYPVGVVRDTVRYVGEVRDGKPHGRGVLVVPGSGGYHYVRGSSVTARNMGAGPLVRNPG